MRRSGFHRAGSLEEALALKARFGERGTPLAGGTDVLVDIRGQSASLPPLELIDLTRLPELGSIRLEEAGDAGPSPRPGRSLWVGPLATHAELESDPLIRRHAPLLGQAAAEIGSPLIRNRGTIGGNICHAAPCADTLPPLLALEAVLSLSSERGARSLPAGETIPAPYRTALAEDEILTGIRFPALTDAHRSCFVKLGRRNALSVSRMSVAVVLRLDSSGVMTDVRVAAGSVTPSVRRFPEVERVLEGGPASPERIQEAGVALSETMIRESGRRWSTPYKEPVIRALLRRAVARALGGEKGAATHAG